jgi:multidrug efflux pump subunit AcrB
MESAYKNSLQTFVKWKFISIAIILACIGLIFWIGTSIQSELAPMEDRSTMRLQMSGPEGASFEYMRRVGNEVENFLIDSVPYIFIFINSWI